MSLDHSPDRATPMPDATSVAVCIPTFRRREGLRTLLESLNDLSLDGLDLSVSVIVVDNDSSGSGRAALADVSGSSWPVDYCVEPRRGEPYARNLAVERAGSADLIVFVDDDERADRHWLAELVKTQRRTDADVVFGPVLPLFAAPAPRWLERGGFFEPLEYPDGSQMHFAYGGNTLVRNSLFGELRFSERYARLGGVDTQLFMRAHLSGFKIVWSANARVYETIPAERMRVGWLVRREFRRGNTLSLCLLELEASFWRRVKRALHGLARLALGLAFLPLVIFRGRAALVRGLREAAFGAGLLAGLFGYEYEEYP